MNNIIRIRARVEKETLNIVDKTKWSAVELKDGRIQFDIPVDMVDGYKWLKDEISKITSLKSRDFSVLFFIIQKPFTGGIKYSQVNFAGRCATLKYDDVDCQYELSCDIDNCENLFNSIENSHSNIVNIFEKINDFSKITF